MSVLALVRHGQASFFADEYDRLSPKGVEQSRLLGQYWVHQNARFDTVYVGPRWRQQQTAVEVGAQYREAGLSWPEPILSAELDEYDLAGLFTYFSPSLASRNKAFEGLRDEYHSNADNSMSASRFQRMFEMLLTHWQIAPVADDRVESWPTFRDRVRCGLNLLTSGQGQGRRVAAFTSGGFIGTAVGLVLGAPDRTALDLNWRVRNSSTTSFLFNSDRVTLDEFNTVAHLPDSAFLTYR